MNIHVVQINKMKAQCMWQTTTKSKTHNKKKKKHSHSENSQRSRAEAVTRPRRGTRVSKQTNSTPSSHVSKQTKTPEQTLTWTWTRRAGATANTYLSSAACQQQDILQEEPQGEGSRTGKHGHVELRGEGQQATEEVYTGAALGNHIFLLFKTTVETVGSGMRHKNQRETRAVSEITHP